MTKKGNIDMTRNIMFPQFGIVTAIDTDTNEAKVYLPLFQLETKYLKISKLIPIKQVEGTTGLVLSSQVVVSFINGDLEDGIITDWI